MGTVVAADALDLAPQVNLALLEHHVQLDQCGFEQWTLLQGIWFACDEAGDYFRQSQLQGREMMHLGMQKKLKMALEVCHFEATGTSKMKADPGISTANIGLGSYIGLP